MALQQLIEKSAVIAEIDRMLQKEYPCDNSEQEAGYDFALYELQDFLDTLEVKEEPVTEELEEASKEWLRPQLDKSYANYGEAKMMELTRFDGYAMLDAIEFGAKWGKEQAEIKIKAQSMALAHGCPKEEPASKDLGEYINELSKQFPEVSFAKLSRIAVRAAKWQKENLWKDAQGDDLPEIDREVVALVQDYPDDAEHLRIAYAHRPPEYWDGNNILTGEVTRYKPKRHDKGGWNLPNVKYWLDCELPKMEE